MNFLGNILWLVLGGLLIALIYYFVGLLMCITIIGIPFGIQLFKLGTYALWPFGKELVDGPNQPGCVSIFCLTIVGIPWGMQHFKMAIGSIFPFGKKIQ